MTFIVAVHCFSVIVPVVGQGDDSSPDLAEEEDGLARDDGVDGCQAVTLLDGSPEGEHRVKHRQYEVHQRICLIARLFSTAQLIKTDC